MTPRESLDRSLAEDFSSKPWEAFQRQNPGIAPAVRTYLSGGARPSDAELGANHYALARVYAEDARRALGVVEPPPPPSGLEWAPPTLVNPTVRHLTRAAPGIPKGSGDLSIVCDETLSGVVGQIEGYRNVVSRGLRIAGGTAGANGHVVPRELTGTFHLEDARITLTVQGDALAVRWRAPIVQLQRSRIEVTDAGTSHHSDAFQTQESEIDELRIADCTIRTDYQGVFLSNEVSSRSGGRSKVSRTIMRRVNFRKGPGGTPATYLFKAWPPRAGTDPIGVVELYDVWAEDPPVCYPWTNFRSWQSEDMRHGSFLETRRHANGQTYPFLRFSTPADVVPVGAFKGQSCLDCGIRGDGGVWVGVPPGGDFRP